MSLTAVVSISEFKECPANAVRSVLASKDRFAALHFIYPGHVEGNSLYEGWAADRAALEEGGVRVEFEPALDARTIQTDYIVEIPPYCFVKVAGIELLQKEARHSAREETHFGLAAGVKMPAGWSVWHGYLLVLAFFNFLWSTWERQKLFQHTDVRMHAIIRKGKHTYIAAATGAHRYIWKTETRPRVAPQDVSVALLTPSAGGFRYVWWTLRSNTYLRLGWLRCLPYIRPWTVVFAAYWAATFFSLVSFVKMALYAMGLRVINGYSPYSMVTLVLGSLWAIHWAMVVAASTSAYRFRGQVQMTALMPLYVLTFPLLLVYTRLVNPKGGWGQ